jgi:hypothetical protein
MNGELNEEIISPKSKQNGYWNWHWVRTLERLTLHPFKSLRFLSFFPYKYTSALIITLQPRQIKINNATDVKVSTKRN